MKMLNSVIVEGEVISIQGKEIKIRTENRYGSACIKCEISDKRLSCAVGQTIRVVGTLMGDTVIVEHMEAKPE